MNATAVSTGGVTASRAVAAEICVDLRRGEFLDQSFDRRIAPLDARDRRWTRELVYGMLRHRAWIDTILSDRVRGGLARLDPDVIDLLRLGVYQLTNMGSVPAYAAIAQTVELAKRRHGLGASKLVNAVLRRTDREREGLGPAGGTPLDTVDALALNYSHPRWLVARWVERWGEQETEQLLTVNNAEAPIILRPYGIVREQLEAMLEEAGVHIGDAPYLRESIAVSGGITLTELGAFKKGLFFVQDPAATLVTEYAAIPTGVTVADLCAAPGGKSLELSKTAATIFASDKSLTRLQRLLANERRLETTNIYPFVADARHPAIRPVDVVLLDVPCTGTGTFRRHPDARWRLKVSDLAVMSALQKTILRAGAKVVKPGGLLIYSTCSLEPEENDEQVDAFLAENPDFVLEPPPEGSASPDLLDDGRLRVLPQRHGTDGAFAARLRRKS
ncbi:MAG TPA: 16S rRNA (cytosine(967)-C(5))-methyltransferase RsmB [Gemmatimonadaceae bacterium]|jgi:16S rRNA (cytosine967-C5)-methyltransferase|nr:16S rRNA (cytosine(967)-C(5))-methyltransferase RsmB [Gemmatimonadaceae bacterium]